MASRKGLIVAVAGTLLIGAAWSIGPFVFEGRDDPRSLDSRPVREEAVAACEEMRAGVAAADGHEAENQAVVAMVVRLRRLGTETLAKDVPTEDWLADWERMVAARRAGQPFPRAGGAPIHRRMDDLVKDLRPCQVPVQLIPGRDS
ncbi:MAG: hypothetical protein M3357_01140 [Actinomycetota bacterium]|nr:hypothetical protein [Actinomycetota bacterium]